MTIDMEKRRLGDSQLWVSPLSVGCWSFGGGSYWGEQSQNDVDRVVDAALDEGVNLFDTAESYNDGASETALGAALQGKRHQAVIATKQFINPEQDDTVERCEASLRRLGTDYVDLLMVHWPSNDEGVMQRVFDRYNELLRSGKVRAVGVSNFGMQQMAMMKRLNFAPCVNELHYNLASRAIDQEIKPHCIQENMGIITYVSLQQGVLTGKYASLDDIPPKQARYRHFCKERCQGLNDHQGEGAEEELSRLLAGMREVCGREGCTMSALTLGWALRQAGITSAIVGCRSREQFLDNLRAAQFTLSDELNRYLTDLSEPLRIKLGNCPDYLKPLTQSRVR